MPGGVSTILTGLFAHWDFLMRQVHRPVSNIATFKVLAISHAKTSVFFPIISTVKCRKMGNLKSAFVLRVFSPSVLFFNK